MDKAKRRGYSTKEGQLAADRRYYHASEKNRARKQYSNSKSTAKRFAEKMASYDDLEWLLGVVTESLEKKKGSE